MRLQPNREERSQMAKRYTEDSDAYRLYLQGRFYWNKYTDAGFRKSIEYFNQAVEKDPSYALAYAGLADAYTQRGFEFASRESVPISQRRLCNWTTRLLRLTFRPAL